MHPAHGLPHPHAQRTILADAVGNTVFVALRAMHGHGATRQHIERGKMLTKLAMTRDDRVSFVLTEGLQIKSIALLDAVMDGNSQDDAGFDTDVGIATGELSRLTPDLIGALGGEGRTGLCALPTSLAASASTTGPKAAPADTAPDEKPF